MFWKFWNPCQTPVSARTDAEGQDLPSPAIGAIFSVNSGVAILRDHRGVTLIPIVMGWL